MRLKYKISLLSVLPLIGAILAIAILVTIQVRDLGRAEQALLEESMLGTKRAELQHYVQLALTSIDQAYASGRNDDLAKAEVLRVLTEMNYGDDGYFFVYDSNGKNLAHPRQPELVGQNLWNMRDRNGMVIIQQLIATAQSGGGFLRYVWRKPSTGQETDKLSYVVMLERWGWVLGTGIYLDDVAASTGKLHTEVSQHTFSTISGLALVAVIAALAVFAGGMALNISEHRLADQKLKALSQRIVSLQEEERARVSRELHDGLSQLLVSTKYHFELAQERLAKGRENAAPEIGKGLAGLSSAISEIRRISHDLRPSLLDNLGLSSALQQLTGEFRQRTSIAVETRIAVYSNITGNESMTTLFRIAQEALMNVERHAGARQVLLTLDQDVNGLRLTIIDDGKGFDPVQIDHPGNRGIGLRNMRERIEYHGGKLVIDSVQGRTELAAILPRSALTKELDT
ncbi:MAG TPA: cache domain-containing protein [Gallionella sp.]|nr:cache domain-containing protein [Gallionella sp.]